MIAHWNLRCEKACRSRIYDIVQHELFKYDDAEYTYYSSGKEVIEAIEADDFYCDLLLLDINMPKTDGLSTAKYIRGVSGGCGYYLCNRITGTCL